MDSDPPQTDQFYVLRSQSTEGPLAKDVLLSMRKDGLISDDTLICPVGDSQWTPMGVLFPSTKQPAPPPPPPPVPASSLATTAPLALAEISQQDRQGLHDFLVTEMRALPESEDSSFKGALVKAIPALGVLFGFRPGVVAGTTVANTNEENTRREGLFVVRKLLELSAAYLGKAPWITYLAAKRHSHWTSQFGISTAAFSDFSDKKLVDETARLASDLEAKASALMDSETTANIRELLKFRERRARLAVAISILKAIINSPHRLLILDRLNGEDVTIPRHEINLPDGSREQGLATLWTILGFVLIIACGLIAAARDVDTMMNGVFLGVFLAVAPAVAAFHYSAIATAARDKRNAALANEEHRVQSIFQSVYGLASSFINSVQPLLDELQIAVDLPDLEEMLSQLEAYEKWALELERFYTTT